MVEFWPHPEIWEIEGRDRMVYIWPKEAGDKPSNSTLVEDIGWVAVWPEGEPLPMAWPFIPRRRQRAMPLLSREKKC
jgi:hypothetical protein